MEYEIYKTDELTHWGIKGMRWGIRRYQNEDGSLTPAGQKRRAKLEGEIEKLGGSKKNGGKEETDSTPRKKSVSEMSDNELATAINRARMEDAYRQLRPDPVPAEKHPLMKKLVNEMVVPSAINAGKNLMQNMMNKAVENLTKGKADPNSIENLTKVRDKLKLQRQIERLKDKMDDDVNWDTMLKKQTYEDNERKRQEADAAKKAAEEAAAKNLEREMNAYKEYQQNYMDSLGPKPSTTYSSKGGERSQINPNAEYGLSVVNNSSSSSLSSLTTSSNVSSGKSYVDNLLDGPVVKVKDDRKLATFDEDGKFIGYWSDTSGDVDGII